MNRTVYTPAKSVKFVIEENDGGMLLDLKTGSFFGLNPTAALIWEELIAGTTPVEIAEALATETGTGLDTVSADVDRLVFDLADRGLISREREASP